MEKWKDKNIYYGSLKAGQKAKIEFLSRGQLDIDEVKPKCSSCTKVKGYKNNILTIEYSSGGFPHHLALEGKRYYDVYSYVTVFYKDGTDEDLKFSLRVYNSI